MPNRSLLLPDPYVFPAYPPELPAQEQGGPSYMVNAALLQEHAHGVTLAGTTQMGDALRIQLNIIGPGTAHVVLEGEQADPDRIRLAREQGERPAVRVRQEPGTVTVESELITIRAALDPFGLSFHGADGREILRQNAAHRDATDRLTLLPFGLSRVDGKRAAFHDSFNVEPDEHFYGLGEKFTGFDKRGQFIEMWAHNTYGVHSERAYKNVPFVVSTRGYGLFVDSVTCIRFDVAATNHSVLGVVVPDEALDYYVFAGPDPKDIITRYARLVGFPVMPPKWALGLWMSGGFQQETPESIVRRAEELRRQGVPCDVIHIDPYWQRFGAWSDLKWDTNLFPDPAGLIRRLKEMNFHVCLWESPYLGVESDLFAEFGQKGYLLRRPDGETYVLDLLDGYCPPMGIIDFTHPEALRWFKDAHRALLRQGVEIFKTDFGESVPADAVAHNGLTGERLHNLYPLLYNDAVTATMEEELGRPGLVWARSSYAGGQRHVAQWGADCDCTYQGMASTLRGGLSLGMCGHAFWGHDIGGFYIQPTPDLYARWAQFGLLSPMSRAHGVTSRLPWDYGEEALNIFRSYTRLRYRLLPYLYSCSHAAVETSLPILRPVFLEFPDDPNTYALDLEYMLGAELLVAPIYNPEGRRPVYLPAGRWVDYWTQEVIEGPVTRRVKAPLDKLPLYARANALLPTVEPSQHLTDDPFDIVTFAAYLFETGQFDLHDTDGSTQVTAAREGGRLDVQAQGVKKALGLRLMALAGVPPVEAVWVNGREIERREAVEIGPEADQGWARQADGSTHVMLRLEV